MKLITPLLVSALFLAACSSPNQPQGKNTDTLAGTTAQPLAAPIDTNAQTLNFIRTEGTIHQDTTRITLVIKNHDVTGQMNWLPHEKDSRRGKLAGTRQGNLITATWTFSQEGMTDTMQLKFKLTDKQLLQKPVKLNTKTGREQTNDGADYSLRYVKN